MSPRSGAEALAWGRAVLSDAGVPDPSGDARRLLMTAWALRAGSLSFMQHELVDAQCDEVFRDFIADRARRKPVSQIIGHRAFFAHEFIVSRDVLDPRPETETLVERALDLTFSRVLDLGTGSGCIVLSLLAARPDAYGVGVDLSPEALKVAAANAHLLDLEDRIRYLKSDWYAEVEGYFDLIVSNPPYIAEDEMPGLAPEVRNWEPRMALTPGGDGLAAYRAISAGAAKRLVPGGRLLVEIGPTQAETVVALFLEAGLENVAIYPDLDGRDRVVEGRMKG